MSLAAVTLYNIGGGIHLYGRPIVALGMSSMSQRPIAWMISAYPIVELYQYVLSLLLSEAFKVGLAQGPFIQLIVNKGEPRCLDLDLVGFSFVIRQFPQT